MKLYRFEHSCYAWKVQAVLELCGARFDTIDIPYSDRSALFAVAPGYAYVPVLVLDDGLVLRDSRIIVQHLVHQPPYHSLVPIGLEAAAWAYSDWCDLDLEDPLFKFCAPSLALRFPTENERVLFTLIKERKYGTGALETWARSSTELLGRARHSLRPTIASLSHHAFVLGEEPTIADAALYGLLAMVEIGVPGTTTVLDPMLETWRKRMCAQGVSDPFPV